MSLSVWFAGERLLSFGRCIPISALSTWVAEGECVFKWIGTEKTVENTNEETDDCHSEGTGGRTVLCSLKWNLTLFAQSNRAASEWLLYAICFYWPFILDFDNAAPFLYPALFLHFPSSLISVLLYSTGETLQWTGKTPTVSKGWKLSLLHLFYSPTSFPVGGRIFVCISLQLLH